MPPSAVGANAANGRVRPRLCPLGPMPQCFRISRRPLPPGVMTMAEFFPDEVPPALLDEALALDEEYLGREMGGPDEEGTLP